MSPASYEGLRFEVRENDGGDRLYESCSPVSPMSPMSPSDENCILVRSESSVETDPTTPTPNTPLPEAEAEPETEAAPKDLNVTRLELGENADTHALLYFLTSQGINTTRLVTEHMTKYGSRVRIAKTDEGKLIGCLIFDNETDQSELHGMTPEEAKKQVGPFIYLQMLVVAPEHAADADKHWKERLVTSFLECVVKNGKIAIVRADADNQSNIQMYQSCGFFTMEDMGIPSYSAIKSNMEILAFTPMGLEGTTQLFKRFYEMGARF
jgi:ribosomal protein S18 acetylase RimI-like enzyme